VISDGSEGPVVEIIRKTDAEQEAVTEEDESVEEPEPGTEEPKDPSKEEIAGE
jgi:hypothetical protein